MESFVLIWRTITVGQLEDIGTFVRIVEAGTISQAAKQLGIAKSAVSRRLVELEGRLGVQLLHRTTRRSSLTEAGRSYYQSAAQILADVNELNAATSDNKAILKGALRIAAPLSFGIRHLSPIINDFSKIHPGINVYIDFTDRYVDLIEESVDVGIRIADLKDSSLIARKLTPISLVLCASPDYLHINGHPDHPSQLKSHKILHYANAPGFLWRFFDRQGRITNVKLLPVISANNGEYLCDAAIAGLGITAIPTFMAFDAIEDGKLECIMPDYTLPSLSAYAVYPQTRHLSKRVRTFIDYLVEQFKGKPRWDRILTRGHPLA